jgi:hypothetical protein
MVGCCNVDANLTGILVIAIVIVMFTDSIVFLAIVDVTIAAKLCLLRQVVKCGRY